MELADSIHTLCCGVIYSKFLSHFALLSLEEISWIELLYFLKRRWETLYITILITNHFRTMKIGTYLFETGGHTHENVMLIFMCQIHATMS